MKKIIELKPIQDVLKKKFPMFWHRRGRDFQLHAVSYTWENGTMRTRKVNWERIRYTLLQGRCRQTVWCLPLREWHQCSRKVVSGKYCTQHRARQ